MRSMLSLVLAVSLISLTGCATKAQTGALVGTGAGAAAGYAIGGSTKSTAIGAGVGAVGGYIIGNEMDKSDDRAQPAGR